MLMASHMDAAPRSMVEVQREAIIAAMRATRGNCDGAAYILGIGRTTLYRKLKSFEILSAEYMCRQEQAMKASA